MLLSLCFFALANEPAPTAELRWNRSQASLTLTPTADEHLGGGPLRVTVTTPGLTITGEKTEFPMVSGDVDLLPLPLGAFTVGVEASLCRNDNTTCRVVQFEGRGENTGKKGTLALFEVVDAVVVGPATGAGIRVLDFGAVWCPPCNLMAAEVLDDPTESAAVRAVPVERIDADKPESWELKTRYHIGGYPTLVAVDASGNEVDRLLGYPGEEATRSWLLGLGAVISLAELEAAPVEKFSPEERGALARRLVESEKPEAARRFLVGASDSVDVRVAKLLLDEKPEDARWLFEHRAGYGDWIYTALEADPTLSSQVWVYVAEAPSQVAWGYLAMAAPEGVAGNGLRAAAINLLKGEFSGNVVEDRGLYGDLADLYAQNGQWEEAIGVLQPALAAFPEEFTYHNTAGRILLDAGQFPEAEVQAREALRTAYGDQRLRAAMLLAKVLAKTGRASEGVVVLSAALSEVPEPPVGVEVRTSRYRKQVLALQQELSAKK